MLYSTVGNTLESLLYTVSVDFDKSELVEKLREEFGCSSGAANRVANKVAKYVRDYESSGLAERMKEPDYNIRMLREKPADTFPESSKAEVEIRWNWWIRSLEAPEDYKIK